MTRKENDCSLIRPTGQVSRWADALWASSPAGQKAAASEHLPSAEALNPVRFGNCSRSGKDLGKLPIPGLTRGFFFCLFVSSLFGFSFVGT